MGIYNEYICLKVEEEQLVSARLGCNCVKLACMGVEVE